MSLKRVITGSLYTNTYILIHENKALVFDPAFQPEKIEAALDGASVEKIILTHGHLDHFYELNFFREKYHPTVFLHRADGEYLNNPALSAPVGGEGLDLSRRYAADVFLSDGDEIFFGGYTFRVLHTPGHTPGSCCFLCEDTLVSGDTLFCRGVGRTDFPNGSDADMNFSLKKLFALDGKIRVFPGHGLSTTIEKERPYGR